MTLPRYHLVDLSGPNPSAKFGLRSRLAINDAGTIAGACDDRAAIWERGKLHFIAGPGTYAWGINPKGEVAIEDGKTGLFWRKGQLEALPIQTQPGERVVPRDIAEGRTVVGTTQSKGIPLGQAWVLKGTIFRWLADAAEACVLCPDGRVAGFAHVAQGDVPVVWQSNQIAWLPLPTRCKTGRATAVNANGVLVGTGMVAEEDIEEGFPTRALRWRPNGSAEILFAGVATAINDRGWVVGHQSETFKGTGAGGMLWIEGKKHFADDLLENSSHWHVIELDDINNKGQLVGKAFYRDELRAVLLDPR
ncbi:hypothetical protein [Armatimonas sp.]|uniref:hypothetical protein n=1 Tax=Armatimonas sp. TaxID=1872638 RepID=UPI00286CEBB2|nr:hypothetical protein [Armatimonas sp.]